MPRSKRDEYVETLKTPWQREVEAGNVVPEWDAEHPIRVTGFVNEWTNARPPKAEKRLTNKPVYIGREAAERLFGSIYGAASAEDRMARLVGGEPVESVANRYEWVES